jgi:hypothetical protein
MDRRERFLERGDEASRNPLRGVGRRSRLARRTVSDEPTPPADERTREASRASRLNQALALFAHSARDRSRDRATRGAQCLAVGQRRYGSSGWSRQPQSSSAFASASSPHRANVLAWISQTGTSRPLKRTVVFAMLAHRTSSRKPRRAAAGCAWHLSCDAPTRSASTTFVSSRPACSVPPSARPSYGAQRCAQMKAAWTPSGLPRRES